MPILYTQGLKYGEVRYREYRYSSPVYKKMFYVALDDVVKTVPSLKKQDTLYGYIICVHDERKVVRYVPKPPKKIEKLVQEYKRYNSSWGPCLVFFRKGSNRGN